MKKQTVIGISFFLVLLAGVSTFSCKKYMYKEDIQGPLLCATEHFLFLEQPGLSHTGIDLNAQSLLLTAEFNEDLPWTVVIRGNTSNAIKKYSGKGTKIHLEWNGNPGTPVFFREETCRVEFKVGCKSVWQSFTITNRNTFRNFHYLVYDGDGGGVAVGPYTYGDYATHTVASDMNSPQGGNCFCTEGNSGSTPVWSFGGYDFSTSLGTSLDTNPENVYFNCFVNVKGSTTSIPTVAFKEGNFKRNYNLTAKGDGWHYISFKLSEANIADPRKISTVALGLNAYPEQSTSGSMCIDFITFTNGAPFIKEE